MNKKIIIASSAIAVLAVIAGAAYQVLCAKQPQLGDYLASFAESLSNGVNHRGIFLNSLKEGLLTVGLIFVCGFLRFGFPLTAWGIARRCFVSGFTCAALIERYSVRGILAAAAAELPFMLTLVPLVLLSSFSFALSFSRNRSSVIKSYLLLTAGSAVIFICAAACESYVVVPLISLALR